MNEICTFCWAGGFPSRWSGFAGGWAGDIRWAGHADGGWPLLLVVGLEGSLGRWSGRGACKPMVGPGHLRARWWVTMQAVAGQRPEFELIATVVVNVLPRSILELAVEHRENGVRPRAHIYTLCRDVRLDMTSRRRLAGRADPSRETCWFRFGCLQRAAGDLVTLKFRLDYASPPGAALVRQLKTTAVGDLTL
ncbi:hypothetical protein Bbelb_081930 [Branchiostoma belcheri]|nr:hypothetical protein Bbelb_081930 [Branchiostoma belcheri]